MKNFGQNNQSKPAKKPTRQGDCGGTPRRDGSGGGTVVAAATGDDDTSTVSSMSPYYVSVKIIKT